jgi:hypothetical protein
MAVINLPTVLAPSNSKITVVPPPLLSFRPAVLAPSNSKITIVPPPLLSFRPAVIAYRTAPVLGGGGSSASVSKESWS